MLSRLRSRVRALKTDTYALYLAARDPRTPWFARLLVLLIVAYALSPIDLIPDFIPVLGYLDDLIIVPAGIALALALIPPDVIAAARQKAQGGFPDKRAGIVGAAVIVLIWILAIIISALFIQKLLRKHP
ncbi:MAG: YkvA family protein [Anaerolineales bacterium]